MVEKPRLTFEITNSEEFLNKLLQEYADFDRQHLNPRFAMNCAITSWHLTDWTFHEYFSSHPDFQDQKKVSGLSKYQHYSIKKCPELEYMKLIANGSKHCILNNKNINQKTSISQGQYSTDYSRHDYEVPRFEIEINQSETIDFEKTFLQTLKYWRGLITKKE